jgi:hypothetical protein
LGLMEPSHMNRESNRITYILLTASTFLATIFGSYALLVGPFW